MDDFQERLIAAQDLRDECRENRICLRVNFDGTVTLFHGTSAEAAERIRENGFFEGTYFSHAKTKTGYSDEGPAWYASQKHENGCVLEIHVDARCVEFVTGTGEFYCPQAIKFDKKNNIWRAAENLDKVQSVDGIIRDAVDRSGSVKDNNKVQDLEMI